MRYRHIADVRVKAWFADECGLPMRYRLQIDHLGRSSSSIVACAVMQNPSVANEQDADKSVQFLEKVVFERDTPEFANVGRLIVVNQFARIQTNGFLGAEQEIGRYNDEHIATALSEADVILIAWGASNRFESRQRAVLDLLRTFSDKKVYRTRMHPSRGRYHGFVQPFELS